MNCPFPNPNTPKYLSVVGFLAGASTGTKACPKQFDVKINSMTFLGAALQMFPKGMWTILILLTFLTFPIVAFTPTPKGKWKVGLDFNGTPSKKVK